MKTRTLFTSALNSCRRLEWNSRAALIVPTVITSISALAAAYPPAEVRWQDDVPFQFTAIDRVPVTNDFVVVGNDSPSPGADFMEISLWDGSTDLQTNRRRYGITGADLIATSVQTMANGDYLVGGVVVENAGPDWAIAIRVNPSLDLIYNYSFTSTSLDRRVVARELSDGTVLLSSSAGVGPVPTARLTRMKFPPSSGGPVIWDWQYFSNPGDRLHFADFCQVFDGYIFAVGNVRPALGGARIPSVLCIDPSTGFPLTPLGRYPMVGYTEGTFNAVVHIGGAGVVAGTVINAPFSFPAFPIEFATAPGSPGLTSQFSTVIGWPYPAKIYRPRLTIFDCGGSIYPTDMVFNVSMIPSGIVEDPFGFFQVYIAGNSPNGRVAHLIHADATGGLFNFLEGSTFGNGMPPYKSFHGITRDIGNPVMAGRFNPGPTAGAVTNEGYFVAADFTQTPCSTSFTASVSTPPVLSSISDAAAHGVWYTASSGKTYVGAEQSWSIKLGVIPAVSGDLYCGTVVCISDFDGSETVNGLDLAVLLGNWTGATTYAPCPPQPPADLNGDCIINLLDLTVMLGEWGSCK